MKRLLLNFFGSMPLGARLLVLAYALAWPVAFAGLKTNQFNLYDWLAFSPSLFWHGEVWNALTYAFLSVGVIDWLVNTFWFATLVSVVSRSWSSFRLWGYCLLTAAAGALLLAVLAPRMHLLLVGNAAMVFGLLGAWWRFYRHERLILMGIGEVSVAQAALLVAAIDLLMLYFCLGWRITLAMFGGGAVGWLWLLIAGKLYLKRPAAPVESERISRLEL